MAKYLDNDKLLWKLGRSEAVTKDPTWNPAGSYKNVEGKRTYELALDLTDLNTSTQTILNDVAQFPKNFYVEQVEVEVQVAAASGGSATLDVGLVKNSDRSTEIDYDGFVAAAALSTINGAGKKLTLITGATAAGALIGTTTASVGLLVAKAGTAVFTAGTLRVRVTGYFV